LAVGLAFSANMIREYYTRSKLEPQVELSESLKNMAAVKNYRYSLTSEFSVDGRKEVISKVSGEKQGSNTHIKGEMVNTPVDIYFIDRTIYNFDQFSNKWLIIDTGKTNSEELLISELKPLSNLQYETVSDVQKVGFEVLDGTDYLIVTCRPMLASNWLTTMWQDFECQIWIDYQQDLIRKAVLKATNRAVTTTRLTIKVDFKDINDSIIISSPDLSK